MRKSSAVWMVGCCVVALVWGGMASCVETAECDQTSPCQEDGTVCFDYTCREVCTTGSECAQDEVCASCVARDACFGVTLRACVEEEVP